MGIIRKSSTRKCVNLSIAHACCMSGMSLSSGNALATVFAAPKTIRCQANTATDSTASQRSSVICFSPAAGNAKIARCA